VSSEPQNSTVSVIFKPPWSLSMPNRCVLAQIQARGKQTERKYVLYAGTRLQLGELAKSEFSNMYIHFEFNTRNNIIQERLYSLRSIPYLK
jgi:hypothetical protein